MSAVDEALLQLLRGLELSLHRPEVRADPEAVQQLLHPRFREFGRSGRRYDRPAMLALLAGATGTPAQVHAQDFQLEPLADGLALLTYRSAHRQPDGTLERASLRSSIWQRGSTGWQMLFHQGTATDPFEPVA